MREEGCLGFVGKVWLDGRLTLTYVSDWQFTGIPHNNHIKKNSFKKLTYWDFPGGAVAKNLPANAGDTGSSPGLGRSHMPRSN